MIALCSQEKEDALNRQKLELEEAKKRAEDMEQKQRNSDLTRDKLEAMKRDGDTIKNEVKEKGKYIEVTTLHIDTCYLLVLLVA
jgi:CRISPR/Cas system CMR subunit Cmr6 (Cas7 group RAMP superfamily)